jgi:carbonic anhydrase
MKNFQYVIKRKIQLNNVVRKFFTQKEKDLFGSVSKLVNKEKAKMDEKGLLGIHNLENGEVNNEYHEDYLRLLKGNQEYVREKTEEDPDYFKRRAETQTPKYLMIGCSDSRVPPNELTKTEPGEIFIHRNIANQVISSDLNCMSVIQYAVEYLKVEHVIVMGHTRCGGVIAANAKGHLGLIDQWLENVKSVALLMKDELAKCQNQDQFISHLIEWNVKVQALNVCKTPFVQKAWKEGRKLHVHAWLTDIETGLIKDLSLENKAWNEIKHIYNIRF